MTNDQPPICNYEGSDYQATFWDSGERQYEDQVEAIALKRLLPPSGEILLELGAGAGRNTVRYKNFKRVVLLDYSRTQLQLAQERLGSGDQYTYVAADIYRLPFAPVFEAATMIRTLHHMAEPGCALQQVRQSLKPGAVFILEYANKRNLKAIARFLFRRQDWNPFSQEAVEFAALNFDFHPKAIQQWLRENNLETERQLTVSHFRIGLLKRTLPISLLVQMDALAQLTGDLWQLTPSVFVRTRATGETQNADTEGLFRCPECDSGAMEETENEVHCTTCSYRWSIQDGIYDFRKPIEK